MGCATSTQSDDDEPLLNTEIIDDEDQNEEIEAEPEPDLDVVTEITNIVLSPPQTSWISHPPPETTEIVNTLVQIGDCIWYSTHYDKGEKGMVQYCLTSNAVKQIVEYPKTLQPLSHCVCAINDIIYIIGGYNQVDADNYEYESYEISSFDTTSGEFTSLQRIYSDDGHIGCDPSVVAVGDKIYIYHGHYGEAKYEYTSYVFIPSTNELKKIEDKFAASNAIRSVSIVKYKKQLIRFGGYNDDGLKDKEQEYRLKTFLIGYESHDIILGYIREIKGGEVASNINQTICKFVNNYDQVYEWRQCDDLRLEHRSLGTRDYGFVVHEDYLILFPGQYDMNVSILDLLNEEKGWIQTDIKMPKENSGNFNAILTTNDNIHLFVQLWGDDYSTEAHYSIPLSLILKDIDNQ